VGGQDDVACVEVVVLVEGLAELDSRGWAGLPQWFRAKCSSTPIFES